MSGFSLYKRITEVGTLSEPRGAPDPRFALPSTLNWMRALAILVQDRDVRFQSGLTFYAQIQGRQFSAHQENTIFEQMLFALHQVAALRSIRLAPKKADVARVGIVTWYYGVYSAASAMVAAQDGSFQDNHTETAAIWDRQLAARGLVMAPFGLRVSSLVRAVADAEIAALRTGASFALTSVPTNPQEAQAACCAYLSGTVDWWRWRAEEDLKLSKDFKALGAADFRTKAARELRDSRLAKRSAGFLHQAFRYRGKANYREALYLGYGGSAVETLLANYVDDLATVLEGFVSVAGAFACRRIGALTWRDFVADLDARRTFSIAPSEIWS